MLNTQVLPIDFGQGLDSKTDPKLVVVGKLLLLQNAVFTKGRGLVKRNGYTSYPTSIIGGGSLSGPVLIQAYQDELVVVDSGYLYTYSETLLGWMYRGPYQSVEVRENVLANSILNTRTPSGMTDSAVLGNIALFAFDTESSASCQVTDLVTGSTLLTIEHSFGGPPASGLFSFPRCVALGSSSLAVTYLNASNKLVMRILTVTLGSVSFGNEIVIGTDICKINTNYVSYDIVSTPTGAIVAYAASTAFASSPTKIIVKTISTTGTLTGTFTLASPGVPFPLSIYYDSTSSATWVYWVDSTTPSSGTMYYLILNSSLSTTLSKTTIQTGLNTVQQLCIAPVSSTTQQIFYSANYTTLLTSQTGIQTYFSQLNNSGTALGGFAILQNLAPVSKSFSIGSNTYICFTNKSFHSGLNPTVYVVDISNLNVVARIQNGRYYPGTLFRYLFSVNNVSSQKALFCMPFQFQTTSVSGEIGATITPLSVELDFASSNANQVVQSGGILVLNGASVSMYDGGTCCELNFHQVPEITTTIQGGLGGSISPGTYTYYAVYQWTDAQGNLHQSGLSNKVNVTVASGSTNVIDVYVTNLNLTTKTGVNIALYRTLNGGTIFYLVSSPTAVIPSFTNNDISQIIDTTGDPSGNPFIYTSGNVIENTAPPCSMLLAWRNNRLWLVDSEAKNTLWYSKAFSPGTGVSVSAFLVMQIDPFAGDITAIHQMDEKLIIFKANLPFYFVGDGADDTGSNATYTNPQAIPSDTGCNNPKSLVLTPLGIICQSPKGIYLLDRSLQMQYIGKDVEAYNTQTVTSAQMLEDKSQIRFLCSSGVALVYDYIFNQWATFTNHLGYSSTVFQGSYIYARTDGNIYQENSSSYLDAASSYQVRAQLSWLSFASIQGYQRVRRAALLGDFVNGTSGIHGVKVSAAYDFGSTFSTPISYSFGQGSASGVYQYRERLPIQKCDSLTLLIEEIVTGATGEYFALSNISLEAGVKRGLRKMGASQSVG